MIAGFDPSSLVGLAGAPIVLALVQLVKTGWPDLPSRWFPIVCLGLAIGLNLAIALVYVLPLGVAGLVGLVTGLSASGLYTWGGALRK